MCARSAPGQASQKPSMGGGGRHEAPPLAGELWTAGDYPGRHAQFSSGMQALRSHQCPQGNGTTPMFIQAALNGFSGY